MYTPPLFAAHDPEADRAAGPHGTLRAHVARANPIWKLALAGAAVTVVFTGPHGYISPRWYSEPDRQVPTWNYAVVHVHGVPRGPLEAPALLRLLDELTAINERGADKPWRLDWLDVSFRDQLAAAIVGFDIPIDRLEGKLKLSQNRSALDRARVVAALTDRAGPDDLEMVRWMARGR